MTTVINSQQSISFSKLVENSAYLQVISNNQYNEQGFINSYYRSIIQDIEPIQFDPKLSVKIGQTDKNIVIRSQDGYKVETTGVAEEIFIRSPNGQQTRIWGDPHVEESDGTMWDFKKQTTFIFGDNKMTIEPSAELWNGTTFAKAFHLTNGNDRVSVSGIDVNNPVLEGWRFDGKNHDNSIPDGDIFKLNFNTDGSFTWVRQ